MNKNEQNKPIKLCNFAIRFKRNKSTNEHTIVIRNEG